MLKIEVKKTEFFNERTGEFLTVPEMTLCLEHSLYAISKWECIYEKSFFSRDKTEEELLDYIRCMSLDEDVDVLTIKSLTRDQIKLISDYMQKKMTARTSFKETKKAYQYATSEDIYYAMIINGLPLECEHWHINKLLAVLKYFSIHSSGQKMGKKDQANMYRDLNNARRAALKSKG